MLPYQCSLWFMAVLGCLNEAILKYNFLLWVFFFLYVPSVNNSKCGSLQPHAVSHTMEFLLLVTWNTCIWGNELENSVIVSIHLPFNMSEGRTFISHHSLMWLLSQDTESADKKELCEPNYYYYFLFFITDKRLNTKWNEVILMQMKLLLFKWSRDLRVYTFLLKPTGLFSLSLLSYPLLMVMNQGLQWKLSGLFFDSPSLFPYFYVSQI